MGEFKPGNMMIHSYPLPQKEDSSSVEWLFVADTLNYSFWEMEEEEHYTIDLHGVRYTGKNSIYELRYDMNDEPSVTCT